MKQLTIRGFDKDLERAIRELAAAERTSWNKAVLRLLRRGAGLDHAPVDRDVVGSSLDRFAGTWSPEESSEFAKVARGFERIDEDLWK